MAVPVIAFTGSSSRWAAKSCLPALTRPVEFRILCGTLLAGLECSKNKISCSRPSISWDDRSLADLEAAVAVVSATAAVAPSPAASETRKDLLLPRMLTYLSRTYQCISWNKGYRNLSGTRVLSSMAATCSCFVML